MGFAIFKVILSATIISFASWLSGKMPQLAGFIVALPITTLLVLLFSHTEYNSSEVSVAFAKNIFIAIPVTLLFFIPFLLANYFMLSFWQCYLYGLVLLVIGYFIYEYILNLL